MNCLLTTDNKLNTFDNTFNERQAYSTRASVRCDLIALSIHLVELGNFNFNSMG